MIDIPSTDVQQTQPQPQQQWWPERWSSQIATVLALLNLLFGLLSTLKPWHCIWPGIFLLLSSLVILIIEAPSFVTFLSFARGVGKFVEEKPDWFKVAIYIGLTLSLFIVGLSVDCNIFTFDLGVITSIQMIVLFGVTALKRKANRDLISSQN
jgi:hypothetical protein